MTGLSFSLFGLGALVVGVVLLPLVKIIPASRERKRERARARDERGALRLFIGYMLPVGGDLRTNSMVGSASVVPGQLIVANHPTLIDVVFLLAFMPGAGCVVKAGLWRNPLTRCAVTLVEFIRNDSTAAHDRCRGARAARAQPLIIFPEGTRTRPSSRWSFIAAARTSPCAPPPASRRYTFASSRRR